jgi:hypothetical protein
MDDGHTGLRESLAILYRSYGGFSSLVVSEYFWLALLLTGLSWRLGMDEKWAEMARSILPTLAGFSIAAYALFFAVLDERAREALRAPAPELRNRSPLLILASSITHAVFVQVVALITAVVFPAKPFPTLPCLSDLSHWVNHVVSFTGLFLMLYGIILILAAVLSVFRILEIRSRV